MSAFCTFLVNVANVLPVHPIREGRIRARAEPEGRMPYLSPEEWASYCNKLANDPRAPAGSLIVARILRHTGADIGEVLGYSRREDNQWVPGMIVRDLLTERDLPRIRFLRQKVKTATERFVPYPKRYLPELLRWIEDNKLGPYDALVAFVDRALFERAHRRAARSSGHPGLRVKDLRHLAAIAWRRANVPLERVQEWLGHSTIKLTAIYSRFAPDEASDEPAAEKAADFADGATDGRSLRAS